MAAFVVMEVGKATKASDAISHGSLQGISDYRFRNDHDHHPPASMNLRCNICPRPQFRLNLLNNIITTGLQECLGHLLQYIVSHIFPYNVPKKKFTSVKLFIAEVGHPDC